MKTILITGTLGFIFSNYMEKESKYRLVGLDKAVKKYNLDNMNGNHKFYFADIMDSHALDNIFTIEKPDIVIGGAAESFVDNSITDILPFLNTNIIGTQNLINMCLKHKVEKYIHISTDEVYGQMECKEDQAWHESFPLNPGNPYSASKACGEHIVRAAHNTHGLQYQITRSCNVFGKNQKDENLIPHIIKSIMKGMPVKIHGDGRNFRQYIFVDDVISGINTVMEKGWINETYNIGDDNFFTNLEMVEYIGELMNVKPSVVFIPDRKAHDFGYKINSGLLHCQGWKITSSFKDSMMKTIEYYHGKFSK